MSTLSKEALAESEIILNKTNIALARSRKLIQSWLVNPTADTPHGEEDNDEDFKPESETAGIGSTVQTDDAGRSIRSRKANNDKLLEQILGKQAAQAHRRSQQSTSIAKPVQKVEETRKRDASDDEFESRASTITQKKASKSRPQKKTTTTEQDQMPQTEDQASPAATQVSGAAPLSSKTKRKANSYLDELLAKKARKKSTKG